MAATEIARQLRLRDMGGIIVVDFIDMPNPDHRKTLRTLARRNETRQSKAQKSYRRVNLV